MSSGWSFVIAAYVITWVTVVAYAGYLELRWRRVRGEGGPNEAR